MSQMKNMILNLYLILLFESEMIIFGLSQIDID